MSYVGSKFGAGVYQSIINQMPPHRVYIEPFLGSGSIMQLKRPAAVNIGVDLDWSVLQRPEIRAAVPGVHLVHADALKFLAGYPWRGDELVYADPPYLASTRMQGRLYYRCELATEEEHANLLDLLDELPCMVALSGYESEMYARCLHRWRLVKFPAMTRGGPAVECLWMNYDAPARLHDYRYLGADYRERENLARQKNRWRRRLERMPVLQRQALLQVLAEIQAGSSDGEGLRGDA